LNLYLLFCGLFDSWKPTTGKVYGYYDEWIMAIDVLQGLTMEKMKNTHMHACMRTHMCKMIDCMLYPNFQFIVHWIVLAPEWISKGHEIFIYTKNDGVSKYSRQFFSPIHMIRRIVE